MGESWQQGAYLRGDCNNPDTSYGGTQLVPEKIVESRSGSGSVLKVEPT